MRVDITDTETGRSVHFAGGGAGDTLGWRVAEDGLDGWYGPPAPKVEAPDLPGMDGAMWPRTVALGARTVTVTVLMPNPSSVSTARGLDEVAGMAGHKLSIVVTDAAGPKEAFGYLADDPHPMMARYDETLATMALVLYCPDPTKHGRSHTAHVGGSGATVVNEGNAPAYPRIVATGSPVTAFSFTAGPCRVTWSGSATRVEVDTRDMVPTSGTVGVSEGGTVPPGSTRATGSVSGTGASLQAITRDAWR